MDCPSRERAGWLCDSYFTARSACDLTGTTLIERNFFENYLLPERFAHLPDGMLPMCYPADHNDGVFIPNWALWFVVQLEEYAARSGERTIVDGLRAKVLRLMEFFQQYENEDGLLEKLPSWVFVEWSKANEFVQDVNYPSNMLYAAALSTAGRIYGVAELTAKAERIRETIRRQSFDGQFFVDNAVRRDGKLQVTQNHSEVCQYFAFFFEVASPQSHAELWNTLCQQFGPDRAQTKAFPEVHVANSFVGNMLRMELLSRGGLNQQILDESIAYLLYMAERTGTLWENVGDYASCNHGFASHIVHTLYRDVLGVHRVDHQARKVYLRFGDLKLDWCEGRLPQPAGRNPSALVEGRRSIAVHARRPTGLRSSDREPVGKDAGGEMTKGSDVQNSIFAANRPAIWKTLSPRKLNSVRLSPALTAILRRDGDCPPSGGLGPALRPTMTLAVAPLLLPRRFNHASVPGSSRLGVRVPGVRSAVLRASLGRRAVGRRAGHSSGFPRSAGN